MMQNYIVIMSTCPNKESAATVANILVEKRLAACVNILPGLTSVYQWKDQIESSEEHLLIIKSQETLFPEVEKTIVEYHPYELPEVIAVPIVNGLHDYLKWLGDNTLPNHPDA